MLLPPMVSTMDFANVFLLLQSHHCTVFTEKSLYRVAKLLTLNSSKTEFLLIGLKKQLDKIHNSSLTTTHSVRNLGFIFDEHLTFSGQISAISKALLLLYQTASLYPSLPWFHHSVHHCHLHRSLQTWLLHIILSTTTYSIPKSQITRLQLNLGSFTWQIEWLRRVQCESGESDSLWVRIHCESWSGSDNRIAP